MLSYGSRCILFLNKVSRDWVFLDLNWVCKNFWTVSLSCQSQLVINKRILKKWAHIYTIIGRLVGWGSLSLPLVGGVSPYYPLSPTSLKIPSPVVAADTQRPCVLRRQKVLGCVSRSWPFPCRGLCQPTLASACPEAGAPSTVHSESESTLSGWGHFSFRIYQEPRG